MAMPPALGARVNGRLYDFTSIEIVVDSLVFANITDISYSHSLEPGVLRGTGAMMRGRTRGTYETDGSFSMYKEDYMGLCAALTAKGLGGYMTAHFDIIVNYRDLAAIMPCTDQLVGCRIKRDDDSHSSGNDAIIVKADLSIFELIRNGLHAVDAPARGTNYVP